MCLCTPHTPYALLLQKRLMPFAVMYLFLYTIGYPIVVCYIVVHYKLMIMEDQVLVAKETGDTRLTNPHCYDFRKMYQKLYYQVCFFLTHPSACTCTCTRARCSRISPTRTQERPCTLCTRAFLTHAHTSTTP